VYGFDAKNPSDESPEERNLYNNVIILPFIGERGCFISHLRIFRKMVEESIPVAQIFEDDCHFSPLFEQYIEIIELPEKFHIVYNGGRFSQHFMMSPNSHIKYNQTIALHTFDEGIIGNYHDRTTHAYIISLEGARFFLDVFDRTPPRSDYGPIDKWLCHTCYNFDIRIYSTIPLVCHSPAIGDSDIR
jgi:glycosyl transferase family 25